MSVSPVVWEKPAESAKRLRISTDLVRAAVIAGDLPSYPVGTGRRDYRLDAAEVDTWMKSRSFEPRSA